jgi:hypothetical protein
MAKKAAKKTASAADINKAVRALNDVAAALKGTVPAKKASKKTAKKAAKKGRKAVKQMSAEEKSTEIAVLLEKKTALRAEMDTLKAEYAAGTRKPGDRAYRGRRLQVRTINKRLTRLGHFKAQAAA